ncbi:hypothetical protein [Sorangium sp. So ce1078]|uniref:hypothetical protein n=1 Tax=Sorangium sp. So ce1078 TaxID=3133329 RepID=UPI003F62737C
MPQGVALADLTSTEVRGNETGDDYMDACPEGQVIIGFLGNLRGPPDAIVVGRIRAQCGHLSVTGTGPYTITTTPADLTPYRGEFDADPWTMMCPENAVVVGFRGRNGSLMDHLAFDCAPLLVEGGPSALDVVIGNITLLEGAGGDGGGEFPDTRCGEREVATLAHVIVDRGAISAIGLGCETISLAY